jgi:PadR family transcriptional regulator PadR
MIQGAAQPELFESLLLELRRGAIVLAVLAQLRAEQYGYSLKKSLSDGGLKVDEGTLYPLLRRLQTQGLLDSRWSVDDGRPRRYYTISALGEDALRAMTAEWNQISEAIGRLIHATSSTRND